jgi:predicted CXXCH cytochrome family protein
MLRKATALVAVSVLMLALVVTAAGAGVQAKPVAAGGARPEKPSVSGSRVVWSDYRKGQWDVWLFDNATKTSRQLTSGPGDKVQPAISGDTVVYVSYGDTTGGDVYAYDIPSKTTRCISLDYFGNIAAGDQLNPSVSGRWVVWEDYSNTYQPKILGYDLQYNRSLAIDSGYGVPKRRPQVAGNICVYEDYPSASGAGDIRMYNFETSTTVAIASSPADQRMPATDGRWVAWMQWNGPTNYDIYAFDTQSGTEPKLICGDSGEQSVPSVGNGSVYWTDATDGATKLRYASLATGATNDFPFKGAGQVAGFTANGDATAWLQQIGTRWQVRAMFGVSAPTFTPLTSLLPVSPAWSAFRFAMLPAHGDSDPPAIMYASVRPGQRGVSPTRPLRVYFSEDMNPATISGRNVRLMSATTRRPVAAQVRYSSLTRSAVVTPKSALAPGSYSLAVGRGVKDVAGNAAANDLKVAFSTMSAAAVGVYPPSSISVFNARVIDAAGRVRMDWAAATDDAGVTGYYVKRYTAPIDGTNFSSAATLTPEGAGSALITSLAATFTADSTEINKKHTLFYTVYAVDADGMTSRVLYNMSPDPHGGYVFGKYTNNCARCHSTHGTVTGKLGALAARGAKACYQCHGTTSPTANYGYNSINNIQAQFWDYSDVTSMPSTASRHGNAYIRATDDNQQCDMCHAPHKKPYTDTSSTSYGKLLWGPKASFVASWSANPTSAVSAQPSTMKDYSLDSAAFNETFCMNCHGGSSSYNDTPTITGGYAFMYVAGGSTAYDNAAGDHNQSSWATSTLSSLAHGSAGLPDVSRTTTGNAGSLPKINCQVCHNEHGSESGSLLDYRRSLDTSKLADAGGLCFKCHTSGGGPSPDNAANNNAWNSRDVKAEFARTGSTHPYSSTVTYGRVTSLATPGTIDSQTDFTTWTTPVNVTLTDVPGSAVLAKGETVDPVAQPYLFAKGPLSTNFSAFKMSQTAPGVWNAPYTPATVNAQATATGSSSFTSGGTIYVTRGNGSGIVDKFVPPANAGTGTWTASTVTLSATIGTGGSSTVKPGTTPYMYATAAAGTNTLNWWKIGSALAADKNTRLIVNTSNASIPLGLGSGIAYAPGAGRLFIVNMNGTTSTDGRLYYATAAPEGGNGTNLQFTQGPTLAGTGTTNRYNKLVYFTSGGTEYLAFLGRTTASAYQLAIVSNLTAATPTVTNKTWPFSNTTVGDGADIEWDGAGNLYAVRGNSNEVVRLPIPADPVGGTWTPETLATPSFTMAAGSSITTANADLAPYTDANLYKNSGSLTTSNFTKASGDTDWGSVSYTANVPVGTTLTMNVKDGAAGTDLLGSIPITGNGSTDLSSLSNASLKFVFTYTTNTGYNTLTPQIDLINVYSSKIGPLDSGKLACYSCHNTHFVGEGSGSAWDMKRVSDPTNTKATVADSTTFCQKCHGNAAYPAAVNGSISIGALTNATTLRPYGVTMRSTTSWPFFNGWDKTAFAASGHSTNTSTKALCENCHDPHGSNNDNLEAWTRPGTASWQTNGTPPAGARNNTQTVDAFEENLCYKCHGNVSASASGRGLSNATTDVYTSFSQTGSSHPVTRGTQVSPVHKDTETLTDLTDSAKRHSECVDCHDPHTAKNGLAAHNGTSSKAGDVLLGTRGVKPPSGVANWGSITIANVTTTEMTGLSTDYEAYVCLKCHTFAAATAGYTVTTNSGTYTPTNVAWEFNPSNQSGHNVMGQVWPKTTTPALPYTWSWPTVSVFTGTWGTTSQLTCSDCHTYNGASAKGPHGSTAKFLIDSNYTGSYQTEYMSTTGMVGGAVCEKCHTNLQNSTVNNVHSRGDHQGVTNGKCINCHIKIPHGWKRPRLIGYTTDPAPYSSLICTGISARAYTPTGWSDPYCGTTNACGTHGASPTAPVWP